MSASSARRLRLLGLTTIELIMGLLLGAAVITGVGTLIHKSEKALVDTVSINALDTQRKILLQVLSNPQAWSHTVNDAENSLASGSALNCLKDYSTPCTLDPNFDIDTAGSVAIENYPIRVIRDAANQIFHDLRSESSGLDLKGRPCNSFVAAPSLGNNSCPFRYEVKWTALCVGDTCINPQVKVNVRLLHNPATPSPISTLDIKRFSFEVYPLQTLCSSASGPYSLNTGSCSGLIPVPPTPPASNLVALATFRHSGANQVWITPAGTQYIEIKAWGAAGGCDGNCGWGGTGGYTEARLPMSAGRSIVVVVGGRGHKPANTGNNLRAFGFGGRGTWDTGITYNVGGGGLSGAFLDSVNQSNALAIAGGGSANPEYGCQGNKGWPGNYPNAGGMTTMQGWDTPGNVDSRSGGGGGYNGGTERRGGTGFVTSTACYSSIQYQVQYNGSMASRYPPNSNDTDYTDIAAPKFYPGGLKLGGSNTGSHGYVVIRAFSNNCPP